MNYEIHDIMNDTVMGIPRNWIFICLQNRRNKIEI